MKIKRLKIENFCGIEHFDEEFDGQVILFEDNSQKFSPHGGCISWALNLIFDFALHLSYVRETAEQVETIFKNNSIIECELEEGEYNYKIVLFHDEHDKNGYVFNRKIFIKGLLMPNDGTFAGNLFYQETLNFIFPKYKYSEHICLDNICKGSFGDNYIDMIWRFKADVEKEKNDLVNTASAYCFKMNEGRYTPLSCDMLLWFVNNYISQFEPIEIQDGYTLRIKQNGLFEITDSSGAICSQLKKCKTIINAPVDIQRRTRLLAFIQWHLLMTQIDLHVQERVDFPIIVMPDMFDGLDMGKSKDNLIEYFRKMGRQVLLVNNNSDSLLAKSCDQVFRIKKEK